MSSAVVVAFLLALTSLLLVGLGGLAMATLRALVSAQPARLCPWGFREVGLVVLCGLATLFLASPLATGPADEPGSIDALGALVSTVLAVGAAAAAALVLATRAGPDGRRVLGIGPPRPARTVRAVLGGLFAYGIAYPAILSTLFLWQALGGLLGMELEPQPVLEGILGLRGLPLALAGLCAVLVIPLFEEVVFRGFLQPLLVERSGARAGVVFSSAIFALLHAPVAFGPVLVLSILLGAVKHRTGSLAAAWAVHGVHNGITLVIGFLLQPLASLR